MNRNMVKIKLWTIGEKEKEQATPRWRTRTRREKEEEQATPRWRTRTRREKEEEKKRNLWTRDWRNPGN